MLDREHACLAHLYTSLRKTEQHVLLLHYAENLSNTEIAQVLELHPDTVEVLLGRIRTIARRLIQDDPEDPSNRPCAPRVRSDAIPSAMRAAKRVRVQSA